MSDDAELLNALIASARQDDERAWELLARFGTVEESLLHLPFRRLPIPSPAYRGEGFAFRLRLPGKRTRSLPSPAEF